MLAHKSNMINKQYDKNEKRYRAARARARALTAR